MVDPAVHKLLIDGGLLTIEFVKVMVAWQNVDLPLYRLVNVMVDRMVHLIIDQEHDVVQQPLLMNSIINLNMLASVDTVNKCQQQWLIILLLHIQHYYWPRSWLIIGEGNCLLRIRPGAIDLNVSSPLS